MIGVVARDLKRSAARQQSHPHLPSAVGRSNERDGLPIGRDRRMLLHADEIGDALELNVRRAWRQQAGPVTIGPTRRRRQAPARLQPSRATHVEALAGGCAGGGHRLVLTRPSSGKAAQVDDHVAHGLIALCRILFQRFVHHHPQRERNVVIQRRRRSVNDGRQEVDVRVARKGSVAREQLVQHHAERKDVALCVEWFSRRLLWRHVSNRAEHNTCPCVACGPHAGRIGRELGLLSEFGQTKVGQLRVAVLGNQNVGGLDVAVQNPCSVRCGETVGHTRQQVDNLSPRRRLPCGPLLQRAAVDEFGDKVLSAVELAGFVHRQNVRVVEGREHFRFALKAREPISISRERGEQNLDRDLTLQLGIGGPIHLPHPAFAYQRSDVVDAETRTGCEGQFA